MDVFTFRLERTPEIVFSHRQKNTDLKCARIATKDLETELMERSRLSDKDVLMEAVA